MSALIARRPQRSYALAPVGTHAAVLVDVQNLGMTATAYGMKHKVRLVWQLDTVDAEHGRRVEVARLYTLSLHERAALRQDLERWRGKKFTDAELDGGFDLERLLGVNCQLLISHDLGDNGTTYANVESVLPPVKGVVKLVPLDFVRLKDRAPGRHNGAGTGRQLEDPEDPIPF
jgi:hypothetical protein